MYIPFNKVTTVKNEQIYVNKAIKSGNLKGGGSFEKKCIDWFNTNLDATNCMITPSCTHALEMMAILLDIKEGDEVIMPSYTFVSSANAFVLRGAKIIFVDVRMDNLNIDEKLIEKAITSKTKAILVVHYAGVACEMDKIMDIAKKHSIFVLEDAAQAILSKYKDRYLGTIGHLGTFSFHETKNITSGGEGGLLLINDKSFLERAEIIKEKGTNRKQFLDGHIDKYSWVDIGSSYLTTELQSAFLLAQLENAFEITKKRLELWDKYYTSLLELERKGLLKLPKVGNNTSQNAHIFYLILNNSEIKSNLMRYLNKKNIEAVFHYIPLHSTSFGKKQSKFFSEDKFTTNYSERLLRLPLFFSLKNSEVDIICKHIKDFFKKN